MELYWFCHPDKSAEAHEQLTLDAEAVLEALELPYRRLELCPATCWASRRPAPTTWRCGCLEQARTRKSPAAAPAAVQARRSAIRFKEGKTTQLLHTLNGSGLAIGRTMAALLETVSSRRRIQLPAALVPYFGSERLA